MKTIIELDTWPPTITFVPENDEDRAITLNMKESFKSGLVGVIYEEFDDVAEYGPCTLQLEAICSVTLHENNECPCPDHQPGG